MSVKPEGGLGRVGLFSGHSGDDARNTALLLTDRLLKTVKTMDKTRQGLLFNPTTGTDKADDTLSKCVNIMRAVQENRYVPPTSVVDDTPEPGSDSLSL